MAEVAAAAGTEGLIGGQVVDLESEGQAIDPDQLDLHPPPQDCLLCFVPP